MSKKITISAANQAAWAGRSLIDTDFTDRPDLLVLKNNLAAVSVAGISGLPMGKAVRILNRGTFDITLAADDPAAIAADRFTWEKTIAPGQTAILVRLASGTQAYSTPGTTNLRPFASMDPTGLGLWSLFKERPEYDGPCVRVIRAADSVEQDIGFGSDGWVDMAAYTAFGTGSEKIVTIYGQTDINGWDFEQADPAKQGTLTVSAYSGLPMFDFPGGAVYDVPGFTDWNGKTDVNFILTSHCPTDTNVPTITDSTFTVAGLYESRNGPLYPIYAASWFGASNAYNDATRKVGTITRFKYDGAEAVPAERVRLYINGAEQTPASTQAHAAVWQNMTGLRWHFSTPENGSREYSGLAYVGYPVTDEDYSAIDAGLKARNFPFTDSQIQIAGDSLAAQTGFADADKWATKVVNALEDLTGTPWDAVTDAGIAREPGAKVLRVHQLMEAGNGTFTFIDTMRVHTAVVTWAGTNNLIEAATSVASTLADVVAVCAIIQKRGAIPFWLNCIPRKWAVADTVADQATLDAKISSYNAQLAAAIAPYGGIVIDVAGIPALSSYNNPAYNADGIHLEQAGSDAVYAKVYADVVAALGL
jgi:hypothetical protein